MKNLLQILTFISLLMTGCNNIDLTQEEALKLLNEKKDYPRTVGHDIYCADPKHAGQLLDLGLEEKGLVNIARTQRLKEAGKPLIVFSASAKPYLMPTSYEDRRFNIQKVKLAEEEITEVSIIRSDQKDRVEAEYTTIYKNVTPFVVLSRRQSDGIKKYRVDFVKTDNGWIIENR